MNVLHNSLNVNMNITSFDGYITSYVKWPEDHILWHVELFHCHVNGYIPCYVTLKSSASCATPQHTHNPLACWFAANWMQSVFIYSMSGRPRASTPSERPAGQWQRPCHHRLWPPALLTPCQGVEAGQHPRNPPNSPGCPQHIPRPPCSLRPHHPSYPCLVCTARTMPSFWARHSPQTPCHALCLRVEVFAIQDVNRFRDQRICSLEVNWNTHKGRQVGHKALGHESAGYQSWAWLGGRYGGQALAA